MEQRNGERRGDLPENNRSPYLGDSTSHLDNQRRNFSGSGNHYNYRQQQQHHNPILGRKRPFDQPASDCLDGCGFVKLYVVGVPRSAEEVDVRSVFSEHGHITEYFRLTDKGTGLRKECCFVKYRTLDEANRAIAAFNGRYTFPGGGGPLTIRYADGERERLGILVDPTIHKLYVRGLRKQASRGEIEHVFSTYGLIEDIYILPDEHGQCRGSAFIRFSHRDMAVAALAALHGTYIMNISDQPLIVRFAVPKKPKVGELRAPSQMIEQFINGNVETNHQSPNQIPNNRSIRQTVFSTCVASDNISPSAVHAKSSSAEMESVDCDWSEHICPDGFLYYYNCVTCESMWEKPEEFALYEKLDLQQNLSLEVHTNPKIHQEIKTPSSTVRLACV